MKFSAILRFVVRYKLAFRLGGLILFFLLLTPFSRGPRSLAVGGFTGSSLRCVIATSNDLYSSNGLNAGFNYALLQFFGQQNDCSVGIKIAREGENYVDSLRLGTVDLVVLDMAAADTLSCSDLSVSHSADGVNAWYMGPEADEEIRLISLWLHNISSSADYKEVYARFHKEYNPFGRLRKGKVSSVLSPYDEAIRSCAGLLGWDRRLLTALVYHESRFAINSSSSRGAIGPMQLLPSTGLSYGVSDLDDPEQNILAGARHLAQIQRTFPDSLFSATERINFTLAAYNAGQVRIADSRRYASQVGLDNCCWKDVESVIPQLRAYTVVSEAEVEAADSVSV